VNIFWNVSSASVSRPGVDVEEGTHREDALVPAQPVRRRARVVPAPRSDLFSVVATAHSPVMDGYWTSPAHQLDRAAWVYQRIRSANHGSATCDSW
jgi:hypothetical protein